MSIVFQKDFNWDRDVPNWLSDNYQLFLVPSFLYPVAVHFLPGQFNFNLKYPLFCWNAFLSLYSAISFAMIAPHFFGRLIHEGYHESVCLMKREGSFLQLPYGRWIFIFILSKIIELGDTAFLLLRGRNVQFLHWYHHLATLAAAYVQGMRGSSLFEWATITNLAVHTWMYGHYAASSVISSVRGNKWLTNFQIVQMLHGMFMTCYHAKYCNQGVDVASLSLFSIYAGLFMSFYVKKYFGMLTGTRKNSNVTREHAE